ncbi:MAG: methyltransferase domain-containing protein [Ilumatobacter sp.]|uniref:SAM-dependent methyltransferase n=1 Tax=Ilumatobacter sp. TaxID=1967498 RepID=UPI0026172AC4|nr:methyltransferase domain-containing protein [Ilumatobacter sp.]MDJ0770694.1 methyltransferase domain-containing protein [Ilumatobacter sp.]
MITDDRRFVEAINRQRLVAVARDLVDDADPEVAAFARAALDACGRIADRVAAERAAVVERLRANEIAAEPVDDVDPPLHHSIELRVPDVDAAERAASALAEDGYEPSDRWTGGAHRSFRRTADVLTVTRTTDCTVVVRLRWRDRPPPSLLARVTRPSAADYRAIALPEALSPVYRLVRPVRLLADRLGLRPRFEGGLGPFLGTPADLIEPLLDVADVGPDDVFVDLGCGDGRLVVAAALSRGCRAIGVESDPALAATARRSVDAADLGARAEIVHGDARAFDLTAVTAVFLFLPIGVAGGLVDVLLRRLPRHARLVVHEQHGLPAPSPAAESLAVVSRESVTVAHRWIVGP